MRSPPFRKSISSFAPAETLDLLTELMADGKLVTGSFGALASLLVDVDDGRSPRPADRRVFAVLKLKPKSTSGETVIHDEYFVTLPSAPAQPKQPPEPRKVELQKHPFRHAWFREAYVEVELLRNDLVRLQVRVEVDPRGVQ